MLGASREALRQGRQCIGRSSTSPLGSTGVERVPETGVLGGDYPQPTLEDVGREFPAWHCYAPGVNGFVYANLPGSFLTSSCAERTLRTCVTRSGTGLVAR
jgi:hypothetical protein